MNSQPMIRLATERDLHDIAKVNVDVWRQWYRGIISDNFLDALSYEAARDRFVRVLSRTDRPSFIVVAEQSGHVVGYGHAGQSRELELAPDYDGELYGLYLRPEFHRNGIGRALVQTAAAELSNRGYSSVAVVVFSENTSSRRFYEALGARPLVEKSSGIPGEPVNEVLYVWDDIGTLVR